MFFVQVGLTSSGRSVSNWTFPISNVPVESDGPSWGACGNFPNSFAVSVLGKPSHLYSTCAYVRDSAFSAVPCNVPDAVVSKYVCQKPEMFKKVQPKETLGNKCKTSAQCSSSSGGEYCVDSYCACSYGYHRFVLFFIPTWLNTFNNSFNFKQKKTWWHL